MSNSPSPRTSTRFLNPRDRTPLFVPMSALCGRALILGVTLIVFGAVTGELRAQSFSTVTNYPVGDNPNTGAAADFNGDGKIDLAIGNVNAHNVGILLNNGNGTFASMVTYPAEHNPEAVAVADLNGDGKPDLAVGNFLGGPLNTGSISILLGVGNGTFQAAVNYAAGSPSQVAIADLNADGKLDLAAASWLTNKATVLLGNGNGTFQPAVTYSTGSQPRDLVVEDFNEDAKLDLAVTCHHSGETSILLGQGDGTFHPATNLSTSAAIGIVTTDLNGDDHKDLIIATTFAGGILVLLGNGTGTFQSPVSYATGPGPQNLSLADFNGDASTDVVVVNAADGSYSILRGNGNGTFQAAMTSQSGHNSLFPIAADFNADGKPDLAILNNGFDRANVYLNSPSASGLNIDATVGVSTTAIVATFIDYNSNKIAADFTATINWGDGTPSSDGIVAVDGSSGFKITGSHTYSTVGTFDVVVSISDTAGNFETATSTVAVKAITSTAVSSSLNPSTSGESITFTATVTSGSGTPSGSVQFKDNGTNLGTAQTLSGGGATVTTSTLTSGTHIITAEYAGAPTFASSAGTLVNGQVVRPQPSISINDAAVTEGDSGTKTMTFTATLSAVSSLVVSVDFGTVDVNATGGTDYQSTSGNLSFDPGQVEKTISVTVMGDSINEPDETLVLNISNAVNAQISRAQGTGSILNDDAPVLLVDAASGRALALTSPIQFRDPFSLTDSQNLSSDSRTRISLFVWRLGLLSGDTASNVKVSAADSEGRIYELTVEYLQPTTAIAGISEVIVRLPDSVIGAPRDLFVSVQLRGPGSNKEVIKIAAP